MTDLLDRLKNPDNEPLGITNIIAVHRFTGAVVLAELGFATRQNIIDAWNLVGDEVIQMDAIIAVYNGKQNNNQKQDYIDAFVAGLLVREGGIITKAQLETILEI